MVLLFLRQLTFGSNVFIVPQGAAKKTENKLNTRTEKTNPQSKMRNKNCFIQFAQYAQNIFLVFLLQKYIALVNVEIKTASALKKFVTRTKNKFKQEKAKAKNGEKNIQTNTKSKSLYIKQTQKDSKNAEKVLIKQDYVCLIM